MSESSSHIYQAIGELYGSLTLDAQGQASLVGDGTKYPILITPQLHERYLGRTGYWRVYPQTLKDQPEAVLFKIMHFSEQSIREPGQFLLKGDWTAKGFQVWRNINTYLPHKGPLFALLPMVWEDAPRPSRTFWEVTAMFEHGVFRVIEAQGPYPNPPHLDASRIIPPEFLAQKKKKKKKKKSKSQPTQQPQLINWKEIPPVPCKLEITLKINTLPEVTQSDGLYHFRLDADGCIVQVSVKAKHWQKLTAAAAEPTKWVGMITGKLGAFTADGFVLESPVLQVFRSQAKDSPDQESSDSAPQEKITTQSKSAASQTASKSKTAAFSRSAAPPSNGQVRQVGKFSFESR